MSLGDILWTIFRFAIPFFIARSFGNNQLNIHSSSFLGRIHPIWLFVGGSIIIALWGVSNLGYHSESDPYDDLGGTYHVKDFDPTGEERLIYGIKVFLFVMTACVAGYLKGWHELKRVRRL